MRAVPRLELCDDRIVPAIQLLSPVPDITVLQNAPAQSIQMTGRYQDTNSQSSIVEMQFNLGTVRLALADVATPHTAANFLQYVESGRYINTFIHRSIPNFVEQGGGYTLVNQTPTAIPKFAPVVNEFQAGITSNVRGTIAMAKFPNDPNSATSEWFFNLADNRGNLDHQNGGFTAFGKVIAGMAVVDEMATLPRVNGGNPITDLPVRNFIPGNNLTNENLILLLSAQRVGTADSATATGFIQFAFSNSDPALVTTSWNGQSLTVTPVAGKSGKATVTVTMTALDGSVTTDSFDITVAPGGSIGGNLFRDANGNGAKEANELAASGWRVYLDSNDNGIFESSETNVLSSTTGSYTFGSLLPGTYRVRAIAPAGYSMTNAANAVASISLGSGQSATGKNFAFTGTGKIEGNVYRDVAANGLKNVGDANLSGWLAFLDTNNNGKLDTTEKRAITNAFGNYLLPKIEPGAHTVRVVAPAGYRPTNPEIGFHSVKVAAGQSVTKKDFGFTSRALISGLVFNDINGNRLKSSNESPLARWRIFIDANRDGIRQNQEATAISDLAGKWKFSNLLAGTYTVRILPQPGISLTTPIGGFFTITVKAGQVVANKTFGVR